MDAIFSLLLVLSQNDPDVPRIAQDEIARRGTMVEHVTGITDEDPAREAFLAAVAPPPDDSHKWFLTLVVTRGCKYCEQMRADFERDERLRVWADVKDPKQSWSHWQVVQIEDPSQAWRWKSVKPTRFPTIILQPPINRSFGDPATVVYMHQGYLPPDQLDAQMRAAIQAYTKKVAPQYRAWRAAQPRVLAQSHRGGIGQSGVQQSAEDYRPPAPPPSPLPPPQPQNVPFQIPPTVTPAPPAVTPAPPADNVLPLLLRVLAQMIPSFETILLLLLTASNVWMAYRETARRSGIPLIIQGDAPERANRILVNAADGLQGPRPPSSGPS